MEKVFLESNFAQLFRADFSICCAADGGVFNRLSWLTASGLVSGAADGFRRELAGLVPRRVGNGRWQYQKRSGRSERDGLGEVHQAGRRRMSLLSILKQLFWTFYRP